MKLKRLATVSMLMALYVVLSVLTPIRLIGFKLTFEAFPILVAGFLFGPWEGLLVGGLGSFLYQLCFSGYGLTPTTLLWVLPHAFSGLLVGLLARKNQEKHFLQTLFILILSAFCVTALNTLALYVDSTLYGYYSIALVFGSLLDKTIVGIVLAVAYSLMLPKLLHLLRKLSQ